MSGGRHGKDSEGAGPPRTRTFRFPSGGDLESGEREVLRRYEAGWALVDALGAEPAFWTHAGAVGASSAPDAEAHKLALRYCRCAARRLVIAELLLRAAQNPGLGAPAVALSREEVGVMRRLALVGVGVIAGAGGGPRRYKLGAPYMAPMLRAAHLVAWQGAGRCIGGDGARCGRPARAGVYCRRHASARVEDRTRWARGREEDTRRLFAAVSELITGAVLSPALRPVDVDSTSRALAIS